MIKICSILLFALLSSCSKNSSNGGVGGGSVPTPPVVSVGLSNGKYYTLEQATDTPFYSDEIRTVEIKGNLLIVSMAIANVYSQNSDKTDRTGVHPSPELKMLSATYKFEKNDDKYKLTFQSSSCENSSLNPFADLFDETIELSQKDEGIIVKGKQGQSDYLIKSTDDSLAYLDNYQFSFISCK